LVIKLAVLIDPDAGEIALENSAVSVVRYFMAGFTVPIIATFSEMAGYSKSKIVPVDVINSFHITFDHLTLGISIVRFDGILQKVNRAFSEMLGYSTSELVGQHINCFTHPDDKEIGMDALKQLLKQKKDKFTFEKRYIHKSGRILYGKFTTTLIKDAHGKPFASLAQVEDITEFKLSEERERQSEVKFSSLFSEMVSGCSIQELIYDGQGVPIDYITLDCNKAFERILNVPREALIGKHAGEFMSAEELQEWLNIFSEVAETGNSKSYEQFSSINNKYFAGKVFSSKKGQFAVTFEDVTERKLAENKLWLSEQKFSKAFMAIPEAFSIASVKTGKYIEVNEVFLKTTGFSYEEVIGHTSVDLNVWLNENDRKKFIDALQINKGSVKNFETDFRMKSGEIRNFLVSSETIELAGELCSLNFIQGVSERKLALEALRQSEESHRALVEGLPDILMRFDREGRHLFVSENVKDVVEFTSDQFIGKTHRELGFSEERCQLWEDSINKVFTSGKPYETEFTIKGRRGKMVFDWRLVPEFGEKGKVQTVLSISRDITDSKRSEEVLKRSESRFYDLAYLLPQSIYEADINGRITYANQSAIETFGYTRKDIEEGINFMQVIVPGDHPRAQKAIASLLEGDSSMGLDYTAIRKDGSTFPVSIYSSPIVEKNTVAGFRSLVVNITYQKLAEQALQESEQKYRLLHENAGVGISYYAPDGTVVSYNTIAAKNMNGVPEDFIGKSIFELFPKEEADLYFSRIKQAIKNTDSQIYQDYIELPAGKKWFQSVFARILDANKKVAGVQIISSDITKQKEVEETIRKSEEKFRNAFQYAAFGMALINTKGQFIQANSTLCDMLGYTEAELQRKTFSDITHPDDVQIGLDLTRELYSGKRDYFWIEKRYLHKNGTPVWTFLSVSAVRDENSAVLFSIAQIQDITTRKRAEEELKKREEVLRQITQNIVDLVAQFDENAVCCYVSPSYTKILGYSPDELLGKDATVLLHPDSREKDILAFEAMVLGKTGSVQFRFRHKDGRYLWFESTGTALFDADRRLSGSVIASRDITERLKTENELKEQKDTLDEERALLRSIVDNLPIALYIKDREGRKVVSNPVDLMHIGKVVDDVIGKTDKEFLPPEVSEKTLSDDMEVINNGKPIMNKEEIITSFRGDSHWLLTTKIPRRNQKGEITGLIGMGLDITERKLAEEALEDAKNTAELYFNIAGSILMVMNHDQVVEQVNNRCCELLGYKKEEIVGKNWFDHFLPDSCRESIRLGFIDLLNGKTPNEDQLKMKDNENPVLCANGKERLIIWNNSPVYDEATGKMTAVVCSGEDITELRLSEQTIIKLSEQNEAILESVPDIIMEVDQNKVYTWANQEGLKFFGEDVIGKEASFYFEGEQETYSAVRPLFNGDENLIYIESWQRRKDGKKRLLAWWSRALKNEKGKVKGVLSTARDITEFKQAEIELIKAKEKAEESDRLKTAFLANISHEIRTPMNGLLGFSELMVREGLSPAQRHNYSSVIRKSADTLLQIINDILDIAKLESGQMSFAHEMFDVGTMLDELYILFEVKRETMGKNNIRLKLKPSGQKVLIYSDVSRIRQMLSNLIDNALKFTEKGFVQFGIKSIDERFIRFFVSDSGIGIPADKTELIFERFRQIDDGSKRAYGGNGLGLAIVKNMTELMGGQVSLESKQGEGSKFFISIPMGPDSEVKSVLKNDEVTITEVGPMKILLVEDDYHSQLLLKELLEEQKHELCIVSTGREAMKNLKEARFDLVLMDIRLPDGNGLEFVKQIREFNKGLYIIVQSAFATLSDYDEALTKGCNDYISKPIIPHILSEKLMKVRSGNKGGFDRAQPDYK
jgi:PAS domain S-box-containing protein